MMDPDVINVALQILDDQLVDADDKRFARIDDLELSGGPGTDTRLAALLVGAGAWRWRVPSHLAPLTAALTPNTLRRIPWELVREIEPGVIRIAVPAGELGFGTAHHASARWVDEVEHQTLRVSSLLGMPVLSHDRRPLGRVRELRAHLDGTPQTPGEVHITGLLVGTAGLAQRLAGSARRRSLPSSDRGLIDWPDITSIDHGAIVVHRRPPDG